MARHIAPLIPRMVLMNSMLILLLLSGCANREIDTQPNERTSTAAAGFEPDPTKPYAPGEFNADDPQFTLRNICEDYTDDMAAELELGERYPVDPDFLRDHFHICQFVPKTGMEGFESLFLGVDNFPKELIENQMFIHKDPHPSRIPGTYSYSIEKVSARQCSAAFSTKDGRVSLTYLDYDLKDNAELLCDNAIRTLEKIMIKLGGQT